jgi:Bcr/CflA subfamily drug resistance transporter
MKKNNLILFPLLLVFYEMATYLTNDAYLPALPAMVNDLAISQHLAQLTLTTWFAGSASMQLILGPVSDRYGRRPVLFIGGIIFVLSTIVCAATSNIGVLLFFRFFQGATVTSMIVAGYTTIHELFDHAKAIATLAWMFSITVLAPAFGPLFGAVILHFASWRWIFWLLALWGGVVLLFLFFKMPETNIRGKDSVMNLKQILKQYKNILLNLNYMRASLSFCFLFGALIAWIAAGPFLIITTFHRSTFEFGLLQVLVFGSYIAGTRFVKPMLKKYSTAFLIRVSLSIAVTGGALSLLTLYYSQSLSVIIIALMLIAGGTGFASPLLNRTAMESSQEPMGSRMAMYSTLMGLFCIVGSGLISAFYDGTLVAFAAILFVFTLIAFLLKGLNRG